MVALLLAGACASDLSCCLICLALFASLAIAGFAAVATDCCLYSDTSSEQLIQDLLDHPNEVDVEFSYKENHYE